MAFRQRRFTKKQPPFTLHPTILFEDYPTTRLVNTWEVPARAAVAANAAAVPPVVAVEARAAYDITRKLDVPLCPDQSNKERVVRTLHEYIHHCDDARLHLHDADRYSKVQDVLGGDLRSTWNALNIPAADQTDANFPGHLRTFISELVPNNSYQLIDDYLRSAKKPFEMDCYTCAGRLTLLSSLSAYLPGSNGNEICPDAATKKQAFYRLMLEQWQLAFDGSGHTLDDAAYTMNQLVEYMEQQRIFYNARQTDRRNRNPRSQNYYPTQSSSQYHSGRFQPRGSPFPPYGRGNGPQGRRDPSGFRSSYRTPQRNYRPFQPAARGYNPGRGNPGRGFQARGTGRGRGNYTPQGRSNQGMRSPVSLRPRDQSGRVARRQLNFYQDHYHVETPEEQAYEYDTQDHYAVDFAPDVPYDHSYETPQADDQYFAHPETPPAHYQQDESSQPIQTPEAPQEDHYYYDEQQQEFEKDDFMQDY